MRSTSHQTYLQEVSNEVDGLTGDVFPRLVWIHERGILDLFVDVLIFVEGEGARQAYLKSKVCKKFL